MSGYNPYGEDYPLNIKRGDVCTYQKISLSLKIKKYLLLVGMH